MTSRTLVVHAGGIGDFLLACPAIRWLSQHSLVHLLGNRERLELAVVAGIAEKTFELTHVEFHTLFSTPSPRLEEFLNAYDKAIVWMSDEDGAVDAAFRECGIGDLVVCPGLPPVDWGEHASDYYLSCVGGSTEKPFLISLPKLDRTHDVILHPGSGDPAKNWPIENYLELNERLTANGRVVEWCLGPAELENASLRERIPGDFLLEPRSLVELARTLQSAKLYIGNDSGISHLAAAANCRTIALFGPTEPKVWGPMGALVLREAGDSRWPPVSSVIKTAISHLSGRA